VCAVAHPHLPVLLSRAAHEVKATDGGACSLYCSTVTFHALRLSSRFGMARVCVFVCVCCGTIPHACLCVESRA
jgi:hypothetical protein